MEILEILEKLEEIKRRIFALLIKSDCTESIIDMEELRFEAADFYQENEKILDIINDIVDKMKPLIIPLLEKKEKIKNLLNWMDKTSYDNVTLDDIDDYLNERQIIELKKTERFKDNEYFER